MAHSLGFVPLYVGMLLGVPSRALWLRVLGSGLAILGLLLTVWALRHLRSWRVDARVPVGHELTASGPFQWIRHPIYTAFALLALGTALVCSTPLTWLACAWIWSLGGVRARIEERVLLEAFGDRYGAYMRRTGRFIPGLG